jgi:hypothetical protein
VLLRRPDISAAEHRSLINCFAFADDRPANPVAGF